MSATIELACASDERYAPHSAVLLHSALAKRGACDLRVHYLCSPEFPSATADSLVSMVERDGGTMVVHRIPDEEVAGMPTWEYIGVEMWYRLLLPKLVEDADRVLYVDVDAIVLDSLEGLWAIDLGDTYLGAVTNVFERHQLHRPSELGLTGPEAYFNSGMLLLNLAAMRADGCSERLTTFARENAAELLWPDQDTLNVVLAERRTPLHPRWNAMNAVLHFPWAREVFGVQEVEEARRNPGIRHFEGPSENKPWHYLSDPRDRALYARYRRETPWPDLRLEGRTFSNILRRRFRPDLPTRA